MSFEDLILEYPYSSDEEAFWSLSPFLRGEGEDEGKGCISWDLTSEQFLAVQETCSGSSLGVTIQECLEFMQTRGEYLVSREDEDGNLGEYCSYGSFIGDAVVSDDKDVKLLVVWYQTTRGTILAASFNEEGEGFFSVSLPESREGGSHHQNIEYALAGRTLDMYHRWYNSYLELNTEDGKVRHQEEVDFHNEHMVPLGYPQMPNVSQLLRERAMNNVLRSVHGDWSRNYGIGKHLSDLLGYSFGRPYPGSPLKGKEAVEAAKWVQKDLKDAFEAWTQLLESGEFGNPDSYHLPVKGVDYDIPSEDSSFEDYEEYEEEEEEEEPVFLVFIRE